MASAEDQAIAAINAAEALALSNIEVLRHQLGIELVAGAERSAVRKVSAATRKGRKNLSKALKEANARLRKKNGQLKKGKTQTDVMRLAQRLKKKM